MTVKELIAELEDYGEHLEVVLTSDEPKGPFHFEVADVDTTELHDGTVVVSVALGGGKR